jgi:hypothetical protein
LIGVHFRSRDGQIARAGQQRRYLAVAVVCKGAISIKVLPQTNPLDQRLGSADRVNYTPEPAESRAGIALSRNSINSFYMRWGCHG